MLQRILSTLRNRQDSTTAEPPPTHADLRYSDAFPRCTLDLWLPETDVPVPLMLMFHGGAFMRGDKVRHMPYRRDLLALVQDGVAVASVGYPLLGDLGAKRTDGPEPYLKIMREAANAVRFLQDRAGEYNLDPARLIAGGSSAGAIIAEWATYAEPLGISFCIALEQPYGVHQVLPYIKKGGAPILLHTRSSRLDIIHHPRNARAVQARCDEVGVRCWLYGSGRNGLPRVPNGQDVIGHAIEIFQQEHRIISPYTIISK